MNRFPWSWYFDFRLALFELVDLGKIIQRVKPHRLHRRNTRPCWIGRRWIAYRHRSGPVCRGQITRRYHLSLPAMHHRQNTVAVQERSCGSWIPESAHQPHSGPVKSDDRVFSWYGTKAMRKSTPYSGMAWSHEGWAEVDTLCTGPFTVGARFPVSGDTEEIVAGLWPTRDIHQRRASIVLLCSPIRHDNNPEMFQVMIASIERLKHEKEILITKAISWKFSAVTHHEQAVKRLCTGQQDTLPKDCSAWDPRKNQDWNQDQTKRPWNQAYTPLPQLRYWSTVRRGQEQAKPLDSANMKNQLAVTKAPPILAFSPIDGYSVTNTLGMKDSVNFVLLNSRADLDKDFVYNNSVTSSANLISSSTTLLPWLRCQIFGRRPSAWRMEIANGEINVYVTVVTRQRKDCHPFKGCPSLCHRAPRRVHHHAVWVNGVKYSVDPRFRPHVVWKWASEPERR